MMKGYMPKTYAGDYRNTIGHAAGVDMRVCRYCDYFRGFINGVLDMRRAKCLLYGQRPEDQYRAKPCFVEMVPLGGVIQDEGSY